MSILPRTVADHDLPPTRTAVRRDVPVLVFRVVAALAAAFMLTGPGGAADLLSPWMSGSAEHFEMHRWHHADISALIALLAVGALIACAIAPRRRVVAAQAFLAAAVSLGLSALTMPAPTDALVPSLALTGLLLAAYPERRNLFRLHHRPNGAATAIAVTAAAIATPFLLRNGWGNLRLQLAGVAEHAAFGHWAGAAALALALLVVGWLVAAGGPGARSVAVVLGVTWAYLGVAALTMQGYDGSWKVTGGVLALIVGVLFTTSAVVGRQLAEGGDPR